MRPSYHPRLVNDPFDDPGVFIPFVFENRAVLFDLGNIHALCPRDILKISHVFVSHAHMDHFIGFDRLLRLLLGREKTLYLYGPSGFLRHVEGKLAGYSWNLVSHYTNRFVLNVTEVGPHSLQIRTYACQNQFHSEPIRRKKYVNGILHSEPAFTVSAEILDHGIPCLGFSIEERFHVNILKNNVMDLGLEVGPWLRVFKQALFDLHDPASVFEIPEPFAKGEKNRFYLGELAERISIITPGQKITYVTDCGFTDENIDKIIKLAGHADHLFIEGAFLETDRHLALEKHHLTAWQAGALAGRAGVKQHTLFHFSPRYTGMEDLLREEARRGYEHHCSN